MRYSKEHKEETRARILDAALRKFLSNGYNGLGVDGMAKAAGVTSGAFYKHFQSKSEVFETVATEGLARLRKALENKRNTTKNNWAKNFFKWYFSTPKGKTKVKNDSDTLLPFQGGCALPCISPEIARADEHTRESYQKELMLVAKAISHDLPGSSKHKRTTAWSFLSLMAGGVILARSVHDEKVANEILKAARDAAIEVLENNQG